MSVSFTITTCKRLQHFIRTMENFLHYCQDQDLITEWLCVDDNSSEADRAIMKTHFPMFTYIWKSPENRGHPQSLNLLQQTITNPYVLQWEDDWVLDKPLDLKKLLAFISSHPEVVQVRLINTFDVSRYSNVSTDFVPVKPYNPLYLSHPIEDIRIDYQVQELRRLGKTDVADKMLKHEWNREGCLWPGFGLSPCIYQIAAMREIGPFEDCRNFEFIHSLKVHFSKYTVWMYNQKIHHIGDDVSSYHLQNTFRSWDNFHESLSRILKKLYQCPLSQVAYYLNFLHQLCPAPTRNAEVEALMVIRQYEADMMISKTLHTSVSQFHELHPDVTVSISGLPTITSIYELSEKYPRREVLRQTLNDLFGMDQVFKNTTNPKQDLIQVEEHPSELDATLVDWLKTYLPLFTVEVGKFKPDETMYTMKYYLNLWFRLCYYDHPELGAILLSQFNWRQFLETLEQYQDKKNADTIAAMYGYLEDFLDFNTINPPDVRYKILMIFLTALKNVDEPEVALSVIPKFRYTHVDDALINATDPLLSTLKKDKRVIATYNPERQPQENEIVVCYGNYPNVYENLLTNNPCYRHLKYFWNLQHDVVESDPVWDSIDRIFVINLDSVVDRWFETLTQFQKMGIPLTKVERFSAIVPSIQTDHCTKAYIGCSMSHLAILEKAIQQNYTHTLVFEDDFTFNDAIARNKDQLRRFFERKYDYDICLFATSKFYTIKPYDDLLSQSFQYCTTASGYMYSRQGALKLQPIWKTNLEKLKQERNYNSTCDVCWSALQKDGKFFTFNWKLGYQRPTYSSATQKISTNLD
jgi:glycosyl transferase family 25